MNKPPGPEDKRAYPRVTTGPDDYIIYNAVRIPLRNWSPVGLLFGPMGVPLTVGQKIDLKVQVKFRDDRLRFDATGDVVRVDNGMVAVRYECRLPETALQIKAHFTPAKPAT
jgi:hypothetical protein